MGKRRRDRTEILKSMLKEAKEYRTKSRLFKIVNTSYREFERYYEAAIDAGYLRVKEMLGCNPKYLCKTTNSGLKFVRTLEESSEGMEKFKRFYYREKEVKRVNA